MKTILIVDDEINILHGLRRMLRSSRFEWDVEFVTSGQAALDTLSRKPINVVVSDIQMPGMNGVELLHRVSEKYPLTVRIALSGQAGKKLNHQIVGTVHQFLWKPCDAETLKASLNRACSLSDLLADSQLQRVIAKLNLLPSLPSLYLAIMEELRSKEASAGRVGELISRDIGMTAKVLQLVNSAFYGPRQKVQNPAQAVMLIGLETVKNLVLSISVFSQFNQSKMKNLGLSGLWDHALRVGSSAKMIAKREIMDNRLADYAFTAGLLHDVGKLVLADNLTMKYYSAVGLSKNKKIELHEAEQEIFGATHAQVGAYLLGLWGLPESIVFAIAFHHKPMDSHEAGVTPLTAVHVANVFDYEFQRGKRLVALPKIDTEYLTKLNLTDTVPAWRQSSPSALS